MISNKLALMVLRLQNIGAYLYLPKTITRNNNSNMNESQQYIIVNLFLLSIVLTLTDAYFSQKLFPIKTDSLFVSFF